MKIKFHILVIVTIFAINANAQVTIGSLDAPNRGAVLELKSDTLGFLPPRVALDKLNKPDPLPVHVEGIVIYNLTQSTADNLHTGFYYNTGTRWVRLSITPSFSENWFYMPSIVFDTSDPSDDERFVNLYNEFKLQLNSSSDVIASATAPNKALSTIPVATDLHYYVTAYDSDVFEIISIDENGLMKYKVKAQATDETLINIVFVEKINFN